MNIFLKFLLPKNSFCKVAFDNKVGALKSTNNASASSNGLATLVPNKSFKPFASVTCSFVARPNVDKAVSTPSNPSLVVNLPNFISFAFIISSSIETGKFTKFNCKDGRMIMVNDENVNMIETFKEV